MTRHRRGDTFDHSHLRGEPVISDCVFKPEFIDLSVPANRRRFIQQRKWLAFAHRAWVALLWFALGLLTGIFWWPK